ncbi:hypothetical protein IGI04_041723 [Brassica rapa subsp. trilocularis]|uniref:CG-1 domain-containing protein n=1 Tax=Brassica rapa subsp. trilocularis TaxID=1813537 RepID=A0ABQ7KT72_BRACM|nr:hypothetical protein IGI04_041723 [Brassica rapa subsp. trilocularis]
MADRGSFGFISPPRLDMEQLLSEAQHRWLRPAEICEILRNYHKFHIATESPTRPASGSLFLFDRKVLRYFRKDGHNWRKKKDGKTIKEAHEKLKVGSIDVLHCYYAHGEGNENFQRRCYWMLEVELMHIVFVHYLEVKGSRTSIGMKENNSNSLSGTASVNIDSAASPTSRLSSYCEDADSGDSHQSSSVLRASPEPQTGNRNGWTSAPGMRIASPVLGNRVGETDSQRLFDVQTWDAVDNLVTRYDQPCNNLLLEERTEKGGMLPAEHLRSPLQTQLNWQIPAQDDLPLPKWPGYLLPHSGMTDDTDLALLEQSAQDNFESFSSLLDIEHLQSDGISPSDMESEYIPVKKSLLRHEDSLKKVDSFSRWASKELGEMEDLQMQSSRGDIAWTSVDCETAAAGVAFSPSLSEDQRFTIFDYWPKCAQTDADVEVVVIGTFLLSPQEVTICSWSCMFGEVEVPAEILVDGVLCCHAPPHTAGQVPFYVTCSNRFACSELREFDFRSGSTKKIDAAGIYGYSTKEASLQMRFEKLLAHRDFVQEHQIFEDVVEKRRKISKIILLNEEKENLFPRIYERHSTKQEPKELVLRQQFEDELYIWLIHKVTEEGKGPNILDEGGQGVLHFVAALGYDWAIKPILAAGVNINFRDANGWSALHWAAFSGRGISGFLAESSLTSYLEKLTMESKENSPANSGGPKAVQTVSERTTAPMSYGDVPETLSLKDSLTAVRNATQAADRLHQVFRMQSFQRKQLSGFEADDDDEIGISNELAFSFAASKTKNPGQREVFVHSAATHIQKKYRGWKKRKEFLLIRQRVVKIQAHVRGHQVRKQYKPIVWSVGLLEKIILRWRRKGTGLRGFKRNAVPKTVEPEPQCPMVPKEDDYDFLEKGRKQTEERLEKALTRVKSMVQYPEARDQYRRLLTVVEGFRENEASSSLSVNNREEPVNYEDDDLIDIDSLLNDDILMSTSP